MTGAPPIRSVVIVGGGTAGWMMAAAAARFLQDGQRTVTLIESDAIGTVGVGEATIPPIRSFNAMLGIGERDFLRATGGTIKLGIEFVGWDTGDDRYFHPFGTHGQDVQGVAFHQIWLKLRDRPDTGAIDLYSMAAAAAREGRFAPKDAAPQGPLATIAHAYHFDAGLYAALLRSRSEAAGVSRMQGRIVEVERRQPAGEATAHIAAVRLEDGRRVAGDLFVDCSGFRSLLLGEAMSVPFEDWSHWLPCDRAIAVPTRRLDPLPPLTRATARPAGWQWRIPLQHRTGNGYVYSSAFTDDAEAERVLFAGLDAPVEGEVRRLSFMAGQRVRHWEGNVVALGLSAGFLEPLESTSIHLIQTGISKLLALFPDQRITPIERDTFNRLMDDAYRGVRDFIILHYHATRRDDAPLWRHVRSMTVPDSLAAKIALFREKGRLFRYDDELFAVPSWVSVMLGQNIVPVGHDPVADALDPERLVEALRRIREANKATALALPKHQQWLAQTGAAAHDGRLADLSL